MANTQLKIAIVEDEPILAEVMKSWLIGQGFSATVFSTGVDFIKAYRLGHFDLFLLDWELPDTNCIDLLIFLRDQQQDRTAAIVITHRGSEEDIVAGFDAGADDYIVKPPQKNILLARIRSRLKHTFVSEAKVDSEGKVDIKATKNLAESVDLVEGCQFGPFTLDLKQKQVHRLKQVVELTPKEFDLAALMFDSLDKLLTREEILQTVWKTNPDITTRTVDTHISRLRKTLPLNDETGYQIKTVYQRGYRLVQI